MATKSKSGWWPQSRRYAALTAVISLLAAYLLVSRAIDTGSLGQYGLTLVLVVLAINRLLQIAHPLK